MVNILKSTSEYPCQWDDLIDEKDNTVATIYTLEEAVIAAKECSELKQSFPEVKPGITKDNSGMYDIIVDAKSLTADAVENAVKGLSKLAGIEYKVVFG